MIESLDWREGEGKPTKTPFTPWCFSFFLSFLLSPLPQVESCCQLLSGGQIAEVHDKGGKTRKATRNLTSR